VGAKLHGPKPEFIYKEAPGDVNLKDPLWKMPEMGVFTSFLRRYLQNGEVDLVVHSWKDLPVEKEPDTIIVGTMPRADPRDLLLVTQKGLAEAYKTGKLVILSSSPRRKHNLPDFLRKAIPVGPNKERITEVEFRDVRGNIQTRLSKLCDKESEASGLIVAKAAIDRFILAGSQMDEFKPTADLVKDCLSQCMWQVLPLSVNPTAAAQGALAVEMLDAPLTQAIRQSVADSVNCEKTFNAVNEERSILKSLGGGCHQKIGCTILRRDFGKVTFLRGQTDLNATDITVAKIDSLNGVENELFRASSIEKIVQIGGKNGVQLFDREEIVNSSTKIEKSLRKSNESVGVYIAKSDAVPDKLNTNLLKNRQVWTAGVQSWYAMANRGVWVNGSSDSLGEAEPIDTYLISGHDSAWLKLTHTEGSFDVMKGSNEFIDIIPTYRLRVRKDTESIKSAIAGKTHFYFSSGSGFRALLEICPELREQFNHGTVVAACGPGNTLDMMKREIKNVHVAYSYSDFVRQQIEK
jgi:hydroxymethylbilane synthase